MSSIYNYKKNGTMEITTRIGCKVQCRYCPQNKLIKKYEEKNDIYQMSFSTFKKCLDKIPLNIRIDFSGMAEPWLNPDCSRMMLYAHERGFDIAVYTTLVEMSLEDIDLIKDIPFVIFMIHLPDVEKNTKINIDNKYLQILKKIVTLNICNISYMSMGQSYADVKKIVQHRISKASIHSRAGNVESNIVKTIQRHQGRIRCRSSNNFLNHNVLLPNGDVLLCCMDYGMKHILGNLITSTYGSLFDSKEFNNIQNGLNDPSLDILCRYCIMAK